MNTKEYLGETPVKQEDDVFFKHFTPQDWALKYMFQYGQIDGGHHKAWVLDQVARILLGTPVLLKIAKWSDGETEYRFTTGEPSAKYLEWRRDYEYDDETETEYEYDEGIAP